MHRFTPPPVGAWWSHPPSRDEPHASDRLEAGFSTATTEHRCRSLDVGDLVAPHPDTTFYLRAAGHRHDGGVREGDIVVIDRLLRPWDRALVVAAVDEELVTRWIRIGKGKAGLVSEVSPGPPIMLTGEDAGEATLCGVVTWVLRKMVAPQKRQR
jgi:DNA polymerase V